MTRREIRLTEDEDRAMRQAAQDAGETVTAFLLRAARQTAASDRAARRSAEAREAFRGVVFLEVAP